MGLRPGSGRSVAHIKESIEELLPAGKKVTNLGTGVGTFVGGKLSKTSIAPDSLNLWRQLGVDPPQPSAADPSTAK